MQKTLTLFSFLLFLVACSAEKAEPAGNAPNTPPAAPSGDAAAAAAELGPAIFDVKCGCSIDGIGKCGNYILVDGKYVPMVHPSLGKMEWCAQKDAGAKVKAVGSMQDGKFVAKDWKLAK